MPRDIICPECRRYIPEGYFHCPDCTGFLDISPYEALRQFHGPPVESNAPIAGKRRRTALPPDPARQRLVPPTHLSTGLFSCWLNWKRFVQVQSSCPPITFRGRHIDSSIKVSPAGHYAVAAVRHPTPPFTKSFYVMKLPDIGVVQKFDGLQAEFISDSCMVVCTELSPSTGSIKFELKDLLKSKDPSESPVIPDGFIQSDTQTFEIPTLVSTFVMPVNIIVGEGKVCFKVSHIISPFYCEFSRFTTLPDCIVLAFTVYNRAKCQLVASCIIIFNLRTGSVVIEKFPLSLKPSRSSILYPVKIMPLSDSKIVFRQFGHQIYSVMNSTDLRVDHSFAGNVPFNANEHFAGNHLIVTFNNEILLCDLNDPNPFASAKSILLCNHDPTKRPAVWGISQPFVILLIGYIDERGNVQIYRVPVGQQQTPGGQKQTVISEEGLECVAIAAVTNGLLCLFADRRGMGRFIKYDCIRGIRDDIRRVGSQAPLSLTGLPSEEETPENMNIEKQTFDNGYGGL